MSRSASLGTGDAMRVAVLAIYLRQRGSPESKPVGCEHHATSAEG